MAEENDKEKGQSPPLAKLPYVPPKLTELATFDDLTRATGNKGAGDNAGMGATYTKTSF